MSKRFRVVGINFDHFHMGNRLRFAAEHPEAEIAGLCDEEPARLQKAIRNFAIPPESVFTDYRECLEKTQPWRCSAPPPPRTEHGRGAALLTV